MSAGEAAFVYYWRILAPEFTDFLFDQEFYPTRNWRVDFLDIIDKIAVEIEGRGHQEENRFYSDIEKYNQLALMGYTLIRIPAEDLPKRPDYYIGLVKDAYSRGH